jgi:hypothetical protein
MPVQKIDALEFHGPVKELLRVPALEPSPFGLTVQPAFLRVLEQLDNTRIGSGHRQSLRTLIR